VIVNPVTLMVGIGAIGWLGTGHRAQIVRSQIAARLCVLLAVKAHGDELGTGLTRLLADMRHCADRPRTEMGHLSQAELGASRSRLARMEQRLLRSMAEPAGPPPAPWHEPVPLARDRGDMAAAAVTTAFTAGEMAWHAAAIDPQVLAAADFSRSADLGDPVAFALKAHDLAIGGAYLSLRGYVAERAVMAGLVEQGHAVSLAPDRATPGFDLEVDGGPVQVKCGTSLSLLEDHFARYPDVPVIANAELAEAAASRGAPWSYLVTTVPGFEIAAVEAQLDAALEAAGDLAAPDVLGFALSAGLLRGGIEYWRGRIPASDLPAWLLVDGSARGSLAFAGTQAGMWVGLVAIGPAGALILGPLSGAAAQMGAGPLRDRGTRLLMRSWERALMAHALTLHHAVLAAATRRVDMLEARRSAIRAQRTGDLALDAWLHRRASDAVIAAVEDEIDLIKLPTGEADVLALIVHAARIAPADGAVLRTKRDVEKHLRTRPTLGQAITRAGRSAAAKVRVSR
ncbi:MAG: hypothetical protein WA948_09660, partial [Pontixanthobacter sp.]